jgi:hypothetical protein
MIGPELPLARSSRIRFEYPRLTWATAAFVPVAVALYLIDTYRVCDVMAARSEPT